MKEEAFEAERRKEKEDLKRWEEEIVRKDEERRKEFERQMAELHAEREANQRLIKEGLERQKEKEEEKEEEDRKRQSKVGAAAVELFNQLDYTLLGHIFIQQMDYGDGCLISFEFGAVVTRLSLIFGSFSVHGMIGIISSTLAAKAQITSFSQLKGGAGGWDLFTSPMTWLNGNSTYQKQACQAGAAGKRVVIEADGREGRRTARMSQDGQTQPAFFTNIPVPFRFAVFLSWKNETVTIESVEVVKEAQMVGGTIPIQM